MITEFARLVGLKEEDILGKSRKKKFSEPRQMYWYLLYESGFSYETIGMLNERDRTTIYWSVQKISFLLKEKDAVFTEMYNKVKHIKR